MYFHVPIKIWLGKKPSLRHFHVWGCKAEVRPYNPQSEKLDSKTISSFFIGYYVGSRGSRFYCLSHTTKVIKSDRAIYFEEDIDISQGLREIVFKVEHIVISILVASAQFYDSLID